MSEAPKRIWTDPLFWHSVGGTYTDHGVEIQKTPYIRADIVDELVEALKELVDLIDNDYEMDSLTTQPSRAALAKLEESHE